MHDSDNQSQAVADLGPLKTGSDARTNDGPLVWNAAVLLGDRREAIIDFAGQAYRLRLTSNNKLILTK